MNQVDPLILKHKAPLVPYSRLYQVPINYKQNQQQLYITVFGTSQLHHIHHLSIRARKGQSVTKNLLMTTKCHPAWTGNAKDLPLNVRRFFVALLLRMTFIFSVSLWAAFYDCFRYCCHNKLNVFKKHSLHAVSIHSVCIIALKTNNSRTDSPPPDNEPIY